MTSSALTLPSAQEKADIADMRGPMKIKDCIYPDCQVETKFGKACEHSCEHEKTMKRPKPHWRDCLASEVTGASCQFPRCDC